MKPTSSVVWITEDSNWISVNHMSIVESYRFTKFYFIFLKRLHLQIDELQSEKPLNKTYRS